MVGVPPNEPKKHTRAIKDGWIPVRDEEFTLPVSELRREIQTVLLHNKKRDKFENMNLLMKFFLINTRNYLSHWSYLNLTAATLANVYYFKN